MLNSSTPDWKLKAFAWLSLEKWTPDRLFNQSPVNGKYYCKICDGYFRLSEEEKHCAFHVKEEQDRVARIKAAEAAKREAEREWIRQENEHLKPLKEKKSTTNKGGNMGRPKKDNTEVVQKIENALRGSDGLTAAQISDSTGVKVNVVKAQIKSMESVTEVGRLKTGTRGQPPIIYGISG